MEKANKEKWQKIETEINEQKRKREKAVDDLGKLPEEIDKLIADIEKE